MKLRILITALALILALPVTAQITTIALAEEVSLASVRLPQTDSGTLAYKSCEGCEYRTVRVSSDCTWRVNGQRLTLEKFRTAVAGVSDRDNEYVTVKRHLENDLITDVSIVIR